MSEAQFPIAMKQSSLQKEWVNLLTIFIELYLRFFSGTFWDCEKSANFHFFGSSEAGFLDD